jgi:putative transposase
VVSPSARRRAARHLVEGERCSVNQACQTLKLAKSTYYRKERACQPGTQLARRIKALSLKHPRYGYRIITQLLREEGWLVNRKRVQRVRRQAGLQVAQKNTKSRRVPGPTSPRGRAQQPNDVWSYDFIHDQLENGSALKMLTVLDEFTRECLGILVARSITALDVIAFLQKLIPQRGAPVHVRSDNGPEFVAAAIQEWAQQETIKINYIAPGSPWENGRIESFHGKFRDGCLNREIFGSLLEAKVLVEDWRKQYNEKRPHSSLGYQTPREFRRQYNSKLRVATLPSALS